MVKIMLAEMLVSCRSYLYSVTDLYSIDCVPIFSVLAMCNFLG